MEAEDLLSNKEVTEAVPSQGQGTSRLGSLYHQIDQLEHELFLIKSSPSWRLTKRLRNKKAWLGFFRSWFSYSTHTLRVSESDSLLISNRGFLPNSWIALSLSSDFKDPVSIKLYIDSGEGFSEVNSLDLAFNHQELLVKLPRLVRNLRVESPVKVSDLKLQARPLSVLACWFKALKKYTNLSSVLSTLKEGGSLALKQLLFHRLSENTYVNPEETNAIYQAWVSRHDSFAKNLQRARTGVQRIGSQTQFSIVMPVFNTSERLLRDAIRSVLQQAYENWELCIVDDASERTVVKTVLEEYQQLDQRIKVKFQSNNTNISQASNQALAMASGDFVVLLDHDDLLAPQALYVLAKTIAANPQSKMLFSDEDRITLNGERVQPYFKLAWNRSLLFEQNLVSHIGAYDRKLLEELGGFTVGLEGSQDWDLALRASEKLTDDQILHIPEVLYHWRFEPQSVSSAINSQSGALTAGQRAVNAAFKRQGIPAEVIFSKGKAAVQLKDKPASTAIVYLNQAESLLASDVYSQHLIDLETELICFLGYACSGLSEDYVKRLASYLQLPNIGACGGLVLSSDGSLVVDGIYNSTFVPEEIVIEKLDSVKPLSAVREVELLSCFSLILPLADAKQACQSSNLPFNFAVAEFLATKDVKSLLVPSLTYSLDAVDNDFVYASKQTNLCMKYKNKNLAVKPYMGFVFNRSK